MPLDLPISSTFFKKSSNSSSLSISKSIEFFLNFILFTRNFFFEKYCKKFNAIYVYVRWVKREGVSMATSLKVPYEAETNESTHSHDFIQFNENLIDQKIKIVAIFDNEI